MARPEIKVNVNSLLEISRIRCRASKCKYMFEGRCNLKVVVLDINGKCLEYKEIKLPEDI